MSAANFTFSKGGLGLRNCGLAALVVLLSSGSAAKARPRSPVGKRRLANGDVYEGETNGKGEPRGRGRLTTTSGDVYEADGFINGAVYGKGTLTTAKGDRFHGDFTGGDLYGHGNHTRPNGDVYVGGFIAHLYWGLGTVYTTKGYAYHGNFIGGHLYGEVRLSKSRGQNRGPLLTWSFIDHPGLRVVNDCGDVYEGELVNGLYHGVGTRRVPSGMRYTGVFRDGKITRGSGRPFDVELGRGIGPSTREPVTLKSDNGDVFEGRLYNGVFCGGGKLTRENGEVHVGRYVQGVLMIEDPAERSLLEDFEAEELDE